jgi:hypothetical protein
MKAYVSLLGSFAKIGKIARGGQMGNRAKESKGKQSKGKQNIQAASIV